MFESIHQGFSSTVDVPKPTIIKLESVEQMPVHLNDDQPLDLSMPKPSKPIYILDSDEEAETITIESHNEDDKIHFRGLNARNNNN